MHRAPVRPRGKRGRHSAHVLALEAAREGVAGQEVPARVGLTVVEHEAAPVDRHQAADVEDVVPHFPEVGRADPRQRAHRDRDRSVAEVVVDRVLSLLPEGAQGIGSSLVSHDHSEDEGSVGEGHIGSGRRLRGEANGVGVLRRGLRNRSERPCIRWGGRRCRGEEGVRGQSADRQHGLPTPHRRSLRRSPETPRFYRMHGSKPSVLGHERSTCHSRA